MSSPLRIAILDEELPYPADSGKRIRTMNLVSRLAQRPGLEITYIAYQNARSEELPIATEFFRDKGVRIELLEDRVPEKKGLAFYGRLLGNLFSPLPYSVQSHNRLSLREHVRRHTGTGRFDLWHCEWTPFAEACLDVVREPWLVMAHNVESLIWKRMYESAAPGPKRWYIGTQYRKYDRFEKRAYSQTPQLVTVSEEDARLAEAEYGARNVRVVDNGVDLDFFHANPKDAANPHVDRCAYRMLFLGSLDWRPNLDAAELLLDRIFPAIRNRVPRAELHIVGRRPPEWLRSRIARTEGVSLHQDVPDVRPFLWESGFMIVPLRIGGGSRLKILESLATACPVVSTGVGAEGLRLAHEKDLLIGDTPDQLVDLAVRAVNEPESLRRLADAGRETVRREYHWDILAGKLETLWRDMVSGAPSPKPGSFSEKTPQQPKEGK